MAKPEWGLKRTCLSCGAKFYDMQRDPIVCPSCEAVFDPNAATKLKRGRTGPAEDKVKKPAAETASDTDDDEVLDSDDDVLEDTSDLDDDDPVAPVAGEDDDDS